MNHWRIRVFKLFEPMCLLSIFVLYKLRRWKAYDREMWSFVFGHIEQTMNRWFEKYMY